jgi:N-acyl-D-amino-acid deacylase
MLDLLIRNGWVVDGSGSARFLADVAVEGDRIAGVGRIEGAEALQTIDAAGHAVTPGFIDIHSHTDMTLPVCPTADSLLYQGITTAVVGQCGVTPAPLRDETRAHVVAMMQSETVPLPFDRWSTFRSFLD